MHEADLFFVKDVDAISHQLHNLEFFPYKFKPLLKLPQGLFA
jgi:hypothetical protein